MDIHVRQAVSTTYKGPTNRNGSRVIAKCDAGRLVWHWDHALNPASNHAAAAMALVRKLGWTGEWVGGATVTGYVFVDKVGDTVTPTFTGRDTVVPK
jgi:hypothetical protein